MGEATYLRSRKKPLASARSRVTLLAWTPETGIQAREKGVRVGIAGGYRGAGGGASAFGGQRGGSVFQGVEMWRARPLTARAASLRASARVGCA